MKTLYALLIISSVCTLMQCKNAQEASAQKIPYQEVAKSKLGEDFQVSFNSDSTLVLCQATVKLAGGYGVSFLVYNISGEQVMYESDIDKGSVSWYNKTKLSLFYTPGMMRQGQRKDSYIYIYDLFTKEKVRKSSLTNSQ